VTGPASDAVLFRETSGLLQEIVCNVRVNDPIPDPGQEERDADTLEDRDSPVRAYTRLVDRFL
jgi:hypothetical protein